MQEWVEAIERYRENSTAENLRGLADVPPYDLRSSLGDLFQVDPTWRRAQHLALLWLNQAGPSKIPPDFVKSQWYAWRVSRQLMSDIQAL